MVLRVPRLLRWFVPIVRIEPRNTRDLFACIVAAYKDPRTALSASSMVPSLLTAWYPADLAQCAAQFGMLSAVLLGFAAGFVWLWPYRLRYQCYLTPAGLAINGVTARRNADHLIATLAGWSGMTAAVLHHNQLALACSAQYLGRHHALTTRCLEQVQGSHDNFTEEGCGGAAAPV